MTSTELGKWLRLMLTLLFILAMVYVASERSYEYQRAKGEAISKYIANNLNIDVPPEQAVYLNIGLNQYDIVIEDLDVFGRWNND